ncbi:MAG: STM4011 family radical SAM protein [Planctomycetia bacterium]|nr:STM4011 family radical SAM protein [Planctomycetia bacterium]
MRLSILYRGELASCNYGCSYCPFAKRKDTRRQLDFDRRSLRRFLNWVAGVERHQIGVLFTPWGEALVRRWYQNALIELSHRPHVWRVAIQTNLACSIDWIDACDLDRLALWATFHPTEVPLARFVAKVMRLRAAGVRLSVGIVGKHEHVPLIKELRCRLPNEIYVWINAYKGPGRKYADDDVQTLSRIDPHFMLDFKRHASQGHSCRTGETVFTVDAAGTMRRCHFVDQPIGCIYSADWEDALRPRACPVATCNCFLGYAHLDRLNMDAIYGDGLLERIPREYDGQRQVGGELPAAAAELQRSVKSEASCLAGSGPKPR